VFDIVSVLQQTGVVLSLHYSPGQTEDVIRAWLPGFSRYCRQSGDGLGVRMQRSFESEFSAGADEVLLVGSDVPQLSGRLLSQAFQRLQAGEAVLGPTEDGGYYLIGMRREGYLPQVFEGILWSSSSVLQDTMDRFSEHGQSCALIRRLRDVDTLEDLRRLWSRKEEVLGHCRFTPASLTRFFKPENGRDG